MLALRALKVNFADTKQTVNISDDTAMATKKGFAPIERAIVWLEASSVLAHRQA